MSVCRTCSSQYPRKYKKCPQCRALKHENISAFVKGRKNKACVHCRKQYHHSMMQFDHVQGKKDFNIGDSFRLDKSTDQIAVEMAKCDLVCANCHALKTFAERKGYDVALFFASLLIPHKGLTLPRRVKLSVRRAWHHCVGRFFPQRK